MIDNKPNIALIGNPNSGKSSLFNLLTGLRQKVGNFPGVTVEKKEGGFKLPNKQDCIVLTYLEPIVCIQGEVMSGFPTNN